LKSSISYLSPKISQGDYVLFGDVKQNIYSQPTEKKDVVTNVRGVNELKWAMIILDFINKYSIVFYDIIFVFVK